MYSDNGVKEKILSYDDKTAKEFISNIRSLLFCIGYKDIISILNQSSRYTDKEANDILSGLAQIAYNTKSEYSVLLSAKAIFSYKNPKMAARIAYKLYRNADNNVWTVDKSGRTVGIIGSDKVVRAVVESAEEYLELAEYVNKLF